VDSLMPEGKKLRGKRNRQCRGNEDGVVDGVGGAKVGRQKASPWREKGKIISPETEGGGGGGDSPCR